MERKLGEIFEHKSEWYQCVIGYSCNDCAFSNDNCEERERITLKNKLTKEEVTGFCTCKLRSDNKSVIFKKLEKIGGTYAHNSVIVQKYRIRTTPVIMPNEPYMYFNAINNTIEIQIEQNKENMEEKKLKLKTFDLEAAKSGKPVCTRDGLKARIICFDLKNEEYPIVAAIGNDLSETLLCYTINGEIVKGNYKSDKDLMMLPEKREGWVNVYKTSINYECGKVFSTEQEAKNKANDNRIATIRIEWEE